MSKKSKRSKSRVTKNRNIIQNDIILNPEFPDVITVRRVKVLDGYRVRMRFSNNEIRELDLKPYLRGPVFAAIRRDPALFRKVFVSSETETLTWPTGADMAPETLYEDSEKVLVTERRKTAIPSPNQRLAPSRAPNKNKVVPKSQPRPIVSLEAKQK